MDDNMRPKQEEGFWLLKKELNKCFIRNGCEADINEILQVIKDSYKPYMDLTRDISIPEYTYEEISTLLNEPQSDVWVAEDKGTIVGMAVGAEFGPCAYHLKMLFVSGKSQHLGIGRELLKKFEERALERHFSLLTVNYLGWAEWSGHFYKKHGFKEYVQKDEEACLELKSQVAFLKKIGRLNNGDKHLVWKKVKLK